MTELSGSSNELLEPLTPREQNVLALILANKTNQEIAAQETLAISTVKWYINQIFSKLGVKTREEAIERAKALELSKSTSPPPRNNLPLELTSFIGREAAIAHLLRLVREHPLVTVTGVGGTGKTRLALKTAEKALLNPPQLFPNGVWLVELAPIANGELVPQAVLSAIGLNEVPGLSPSAVLAEFLCARQALLLLDNCEHVIEAASQLAHELLQSCSEVHILATSREILGVEGEVPFRCASLSLPGPQDRQDPADLARYEAVRLFVDRAERVSPSFTLDNENAPLIARICQRLDGIPLAIELAAARVRLLSVEQIADRLDHVFRLLTGGSRTTMPRHQTLKALIDWSYNLLSEKERLLFLRLSVFSGGWTLEAAEAICADPPDGKGWLPVEEILDLLGQLMDKSLIELGPRSKSSQPRYHMLETIRQYARENLAGDPQLVSGEAEAVREHHLNYFLSLCLQADQQLRGRNLRLWREKLDDELDNLRLAMEWAEQGSVEKGLTLAAALYLYWFYYREEEGVQWLEQLLATEAAAPENQRSAPARRAARGRALNVLADIGSLYGRDQSSLAREATAIFEALGEGYEIDRAMALSMWSEKDLLEILARFRQIGDPFYIAYALWPLILETWHTGNLAQARAYAEESQAMYQRIEYFSGLRALSIFNWYLELMEGNLPRAQEYQKAAQAYAELAGESSIGLETCLGGWVALYQGNYMEAQRIFEDDLAARREKGYHGYIAELLGALGYTAWASGDDDLARQYAQETLRLPGWVSDISLRTARYVLARTAIIRGQYEQAFTALKDSLLHWNDNGYVMIPAQLVLQAFGILAAAQFTKPEQAQRAAVLFGAQDFISKNLMNIMTPPEREAYNHSLASVRAALSEQDFASAWAEGQAMTTRKAIQYAISISPLAHIAAVI